MRSFCLCLALGTAVLSQPFQASAQGQYHGRSLHAYPSTPARTAYAAQPLVVVYYPVAVGSYSPAPLPYGGALNRQPEQTREVILYDGYFSPSVLTVPAGTLVRWKNRSRHQHTVTLSPLLDSGPLAAGGEFRLYFPFPGTYHYYCRFHPYLMKGVVTVY